MTCVSFRVRFHEVRIFGSCRCWYDCLCVNMAATACIAYNSTIMDDKIIQCYFQHFQLQCIKINGSSLEIFYDSSQLILISNGLFCIMVVYSDHYLSWMSNHNSMDGARKGCYPHPVTLVYIPKHVCKLDADRQLSTIHQQPTRNGSLTSLLGPSK